jgi:hypothetical protein
MNNVRVERMLRELHAGPPLRFLEDLFSLTEIVKRQMAALRARKAAEEQQVGAPVLAGGGAVR